MDARFLSWENNLGQKKAIGSHSLFGEMSTDMFEAYAPLQSHAMERPLILRKQRADPRARLGSRSMKAEHGELVWYTVLKSVCEPVIVIEADPRIHVIHIRPADLHVLRSSHIGRRTTPGVRGAPGARPISRCICPTERRWRAIDQVGKDPALILHANQCMVVVWTIIPTIQDPRPSAVAGIDDQ